MDFLKANSNRYSVRSFSDKDVDDKILTDIVAQAQRAPSWANAQPWKVYIAKGATLDRIKQAYHNNNIKGLTGDSDFYTMHRNQWGDFARKNMADWNNNFSRYLIMNRVNLGSLADHLFDAPAVAFLTVEEFNPWSIYDLGAFGQTLMLAASNQGLATVPAYEFVRFPDVLRANMSIPDNELIGMGIGIGYASENKVNGFHSTRVNTNEVLKILK